MKTFCIATLFILLSCLSQAQKKKDFKDLIEAGDFYYAQELYTKAADFYSQANQLDPDDVYSSFQVAECYRKTYSYEEASEFYAKTADLDVINYPTAIYYQALMMKLTGRFAEAIDWFDAFINLSQLRDFDDKEIYADQAVIEKEGCYLALKHLLEPERNYQFTHLELPLNSEFNDFAVSIYLNDSSLVFTSGRMEATGGAVDHRFGEAFTDNFRFLKTDQGWSPDKTNDKFARVNSKRNDGAGFFNRDRDKFYFTGCKDPSGGHCKIYVSQRTDGEWEEPEELNRKINLPKTESKHPTLSKNGDTLFFVSNREGGQGGSDLWMSITADQDLWGPPINLGDRINTPYDEVSPFFDGKRSRLFFASNGHVGFGGMDIYMVKGNSLDHADILNLGPEFNSNREEGYLVLGEEFGYLSSNRNEGLGNFDIYQFGIHSLIRNLEREEQPAGRSRTLRSRRIKVSGSDVAAVEEQDRLYYQGLEGDEKEMFDRLVQYEAMRNEFFNNNLLTLNDQKFLNTLSSQEKEIIGRFAAEKYLGHNPMIKNTCRLVSFQSTPDQDFQSILVTGKVLDQFDQKPAQNLMVSLSDTTGVVLKIATTNSNGDFKFYNLDLNQTYNLILENCSGLESVYKVEQLAKDGYNPSDYVADIENVYFDSNQHDLRPESKLALVDLFKFYQTNINAQIEVFAHTDSVGSTDYNLELSRKRGKSVFNFLTEMGIDHTGIVIWAIGKNSPSANNSSPEGRQFNRRVEFVINGQSVPLKPACYTLITTKEVHLPDLAREIGLPLSTIKQVNGIDSNQVKAYSPMRITTNVVDKLPSGLFFKSPFAQDSPAQTQ